MVWRTRMQSKKVQDYIFAFDVDKDADGGVKNFQGLQLYNALASGPLFPDIHSERLTFVRVSCIEHDRFELVPVDNYERDLWGWYEAGKHPRFSIVGAFIEAGQKGRDIDRLMERWNQEGRRHIVDALKISKTKKEFIKNMHPHLYSAISVGNRRPRVTNTFKKKFDAKSFTIEDFFREDNQELRRHILRFVPIQKILKRMKRIGKDKEGVLYGDNGRNRTYLYVTCPSTAQEYLLQVPNHFEKPAAARRWTFDIPEKAKFAKEA